MKEYNEYKCHKTEKIKTTDFLCSFCVYTVHKYECTFDFPMEIIELQISIYIVTCMSECRRG